MQIFVRDNGKITVINVEKSTKIGELREKIKIACQKPSTDFELYYNKNTLNDNNQTIESMNVKNESILFLVELVLGGLN